MTAEQKKMVKMKLLLDVKRYSEEAAGKTQQGQETDVEMFMIDMTLENIKKLDAQFPNE